MYSAAFSEAARKEGFLRLGEQAFRVRMRAWWHPGEKIQLLEVPGPRGGLVKGSKSYRVVAITEEGVTWARDLGPLHDYLEAHFPDLHLGFSFFRDLTPAVVGRHLERKREVEAPTRERVSGEDLARVQDRIRGSQEELGSLESLRGQTGGEEGLLSTYLREEAAVRQRDLAQLREKASGLAERVAWEGNLLRRYLEQGSGATLRFSVASHLHVVEEGEGFRDAVRAIRKELADLHRHQVSQKLAGGRLNVQVREEEHPSLVWIEEVLGAALTPRELAGLGGEHVELREAGEASVMVSPDEDLEVEGGRVDDRKLVAARVVGALLERVDRPDRGGDGLEALARDGMGAFVGMRMEGEKSTSRPCVLPLDRLNHVYASGTTGSGKSFAGRVLVEEACLLGLNVLCIDPRNQMVGLRVPEDREGVLARSGECGKSWLGARGFDVAIHAPALDSGSMPKDLASLAQGRHVVSLKGLDDRERCEWFSRILDAVFEAQAHEEAERLKFLLVIEESQRFTKKKVGEEAKEAAERAERALDRTVREARKFGCCVVIISQTIRDFAYDSASIRQNTNTKVFLHNSDREVEYAATFLEDGKRIVKLQPGTAVVFHPAWGDVTVRVRPPYSKVWEFNEEATRELMGSPGAAARPLSGDAEAMLSWVVEQYAATGQGAHLARIADALGFGSRRRLYEALSELETARKVRTRQLQERGRPRLVEPVSARVPDGTLDGTGTKSGGPR